MIGTLQDSICRKAANDVLDEFPVGAPDEIDLEMLAWIGGRRLRIVEGGLECVEGRLVATTRGGVIRIRKDITPLGRKRFTIAHEIGHRVLHGIGSTCDTLKDIRTWRKGSKETEVNIFAGELLMPENLFKPLVSAEDPSLGFVDKLADTFRTSSLAATVHFVMHTNEPCALVVSKDGMYEWSKKSPSFEFFIRGEELHAYTGAAELFTAKSTTAKGMTATPAGAWLDHYDPEGKSSILEDSRFLYEHSEVVTLLWIKDLLE